jgi:dienelactone hydrolase
MPTPAALPCPVVLLGHGGSGHKRSQRIVGLARWFAAQGLASAAIDGPYHGDRYADDYQERIAKAGVERVLGRMTRDWRATIDTLTSEGVADAGRIGYLGLSMATRFGLPLAAAMGSKLRGAVLGKFGLRQGPALHPGLESAARVSDDARSLVTPVLFHVQWDDEVFPRDGQLELFDLIGSADKQLAAFPGTHSDTKDDALDLWREFICRHLAKHQ